MKDNDKEVSEGLNQIFEIINAKGDVGELKEIVNDYQEGVKDQQKFIVYFIHFELIAL